MDSSSSPVRGATLKTLATSLKRWPSLSPGFEPGLLKHLRQLPELCGASTLPGHLPAARLPGHRSGHGRAAEGGQEPGMFPSVGFLPRAGGGGGGKDSAHNSRVGRGFPFHLSHQSPRVRFPLQPKSRVVTVHLTNRLLFRSARHTHSLRGGVAGG